MKAEEASTMAIASKDLVSLVVGAVFGTLFLIVCIISAVKAVRDRHRIIERNAAKRAAKEARANGVHPPPAPTKKPNIMIIHDNAKAEKINDFMQVKNARSASAASTAPPSPHTETTTAEMAYNSHDHSMHLSSTSDILDRSNSENDFNALSPIPPSTQLSGRRYGTSRAHDRDRDTFQNGGPPTHVFSANRRASNSSPDVRYGGEFTDIREEADRSPGPLQNGHVPEKYRQAENGVPNSSSFHGFSRSTNNNSNSAYSRYVCAKYNPRRNSYAAAIANPSWIELPPLRRHSDEANHLANYMRSAHGESNHVRDRRSSQEGAVNPAYDGADDAVAL